MSYCDEYIELISAAIDGALSPAQREKLEAHLAQCPECNALYAALSALHATLADLPPAEVPADLTERIMTAVAAEQVLPFAPAETKKAPIRWQRWLASAAVLAVVLMGAWSWKPWEHSVNDLKSQSAELQQPAGKEKPETVGILPEASMAAADNDAMAAPEASALLNDNNALPADAPETTPAPAPASAEAAAPKVAGKTPEEKAAAPDAAPGEGSAEGEGTVIPRMAPVSGEGADAGPVLRSAPLPEPENGGGDSNEPAPALFSAPQPIAAPEETEAETPEATEIPAVQSFTVSSKLTGSNEPSVPVALTSREALDRLLEEYPMPEDASVVDTGEVLGWETPLSPVDGDTDPNAQQASTRLEYVGLSPNGKYHEFWLSSFLLDDPAEGLAHSSTINFFAVPLNGGEILVQRTEEPKSAQEHQAEIEAYLQALQE